MGFISGKALINTPAALFYKAPLARRFMRCI